MLCQQSSCSFGVEESGLNTFTSFHAPSRDMCGWSMHTVGSKGNSPCNSGNEIMSTQLESTHSWSVDGSKEADGSSV